LDGDVVVLVSFLLVLAAAVTLVIGLLNSGLGLIYVSIGCSVAAGVVLARAVVRSRPERAAATQVGTERLRALEETETPTVTVVPPRKRGAAAEDVDELDVEEAGVSPNGESLFPIADYDELKVGEIVSLLPELDRDELEMVRDREADGKNRSTILTRVEALVVAAGDDEWDSEDAEDSEAGWDEGEEEEEEGEEAAGDESLFPIADYDELKAAEVVSLLPELDDDELEEVRDREGSGANRATVLKRIDQLLGIEEAPPKRAPAKKQAKKAQPKKAATKKTAARTTKKAASTSTRKAASTRKSASTRTSTGTRKTSARKTTAKKR
jgi:hypothetical protein